MSDLVSPELEAQAIAWRRHLHANPELSFAEHETSRFVEETLHSFGAFDIERPTPTSVVARLRGDRPGKVLALRADMDALPIQEEVDLPFASRVAGVMHACAHDGHTAMLLATAKLLAARRGELAGEARLVFQHAEELPPGGARELVELGVLDGVDAVVGAHLMSTYQVGTVAAQPGALMAAADTIEIEIVGQGGHAAYPHTTVDPIVVAAQAVTAVQQIVSREVDPLDNAVVSITQVHAGTADNVIPESVRLRGTVRTFRPESRAAVRDAIERIVRGVTEAHRAGYRFVFEEGYEAVVNDAGVAALVADAARRELGDEMVVEVAADHGRRGLLRLSVRCARRVLLRGRAPRGARPRPAPQSALRDRRGVAAQRDRGADTHCARRTRAVVAGKGTPAILAAERAGVAHRVHEYAHDPRAPAYGREAAEKLGVDSARVFKTLVVDTDGTPTVAIVPVESELDLRALGKRATLARTGDAERVTGYVTGGISPLGQRKSLRTLLDESALAFETIYVSAGRRGLEIELAPGDLLALTGGEARQLRRNQA